MPFSTPTFEQIRDDLLRDIKNLVPDADTGPDSDYRVRASSVASAISGLYQHQQWVARQIFPDSADSDYLVRHAALRGLTPKNATVATGSIRVSGTAGAVVPAGTQGQIAGVLYATTLDATLDNTGAATISAQADQSGSAGNQASGTIIMLLSPPAGVSAQASINAMTGGADDETPADLLARLLFEIRRPPAGGNKYDFQRWAMEVDGVSQAYVYPKRRGIGTVDVVITSAGTLPSQAILDAVQAHVDDKRNATGKDFLALAPTLLSYDVTVQVKLAGITLSDATAQIQQALSDYDAGVAPGDAVYKSRVEAIISDIQGVTDRAVSIPSANVVPVVDATKVEWARLGTVTVSLMP